MLQIQHINIDPQMLELYLTELEKRSPCKMARVRCGDALCDSLIRLNNIFTCAMQDYKEAYRIALSQDMRVIESLNSQWQWKRYVYAGLGGVVGAGFQAVINMNSYFRFAAGLFQPRALSEEGPAFRIAERYTNYPKTALFFGNFLLGMACSAYKLSFPVVAGVFQGLTYGLDKEQRDALFYGSENRNRFITFFKEMEAERINQLSRIIFDELSSILLLPTRTDREIIDMSQLYAVFRSSVTGMNLFVKEDGRLVMREAADPGEIPFRQYLGRLSLNG